MARPWTSNLQNHELNNLFIFINYLVSGILSKQQKMDQDTELYKPKRSPELNSNSSSHQLSDFGPLWVSTSLFVKYQSSISEAIASIK
jgi:hypothetical protein